MAEISSNDMLKFVLVIGIIYVIYTVYFSKNEGLDNTSTTTPMPTPEWLHPVSDTLAGEPSHATILVQPSSSSNDAPIGTSSADQLTTADLLPKYDDANSFAKQNPVSQLLQEQNFITSGYHMGINTVVQSNKIPYLDIRELPPIAKQSVGPWSQSSYEEPAGAKRRGNVLAA